MAGKTVLVTGGAGYVGSHACKAFRQAGWNVVVFDNLSRGWSDLVRWGDLIEGDIRQPDDLDAAFKAVQPDAVAHFAAFAYVGESVEQPELYYENNVVGTLNLLRSMAEHGVKNLIFSSSCATYGIADTPITEDTSQRPINPYGNTKYVAELMIKDFERSHGIRSMLLRYFNASGCDADLETGERHDPEPHVIPLAIKGARDGTFTFTINGKDFDTPDGTCIRDYVHVTDLADAHARALDYLEQGGASEACNLGTGQGTSVLELADAIERVAGVELPRVFGPPRPGDPARLVASAEKARTLLGWEPQHSDLETIVRTAWAWFEKDERPNH